MLKYYKNFTNCCRSILAAVCFSQLFLVYSCNNFDGKQEQVSDIQVHNSGEATIEAENIFFLFLAKVKASDKVSDSLLLVWDREARTIYHFDTSLKLVKHFKVPSKIEDIGTFDHFNNSYYLLTEKEMIQYDDELSRKVRSFAFDFSEADGFHTIMNDLRIQNDSSFYVLKFPKNSSMNSKGSRERYFNTKLVNKVHFKPDSSLVYSSLDIPFPERYKKQIYNDHYPIYAPFHEADLVYTFGHWDSIAFLKQEQVHHYAIPKRFSVQSEPFLIGDMNSVTRSKEYSNTNNANMKLLVWNNKILLFQQIGAETYVDENSGKINDYLSLNKRMIVFDMGSKKFDKEAYTLPRNSNPVRSIIFNGKLCLLSTDETRQNVTINQIDLN